MAGDAFALTVLHNYFFRQYQLAGTYVPLAVRPEGLDAALRALRRSDLPAAI
jgi:shikimate 5-dehydrogenase